LTAALLAGAAEPALAQGNRTKDANGAAAPNGDEWNLAVGETRTVSARGIKNYSEGVPGVVEVKLTTDNNDFVVAGRHAGSTTLLLIRDDGTQKPYTINVFARNPVAVERELRQLLEGFSHVRVRRIGAREVIDGWVNDESEKKRVDHAAELYAGQVESLVTVGPNGAAFDETQPGDRSLLVRIDFYFVQLDETSSYAFGLKWPGAIGGGSAQISYDLIANSTTQAALTVSQPLPQLDMAAAHGWGKVLKHATVITRSGSEAVFQNGGEQNFVVNTGLTVGLQAVPFGLEVGVVPAYNAGRADMDLKIHANVADLTVAGAGTNIPGRTTSRLSTLVNVRLGQSIVLSGIQTSAQQHNVTGVPLLSRIPVLGVLFGSHQNATQETTGAIYIVPNVIDAASASSVDLVDNAVKRFKDYDGKVEGVHLYDETPPKGQRR
jgi:pilus assembly protein CpaC